MSLACQHICGIAIYYRVCMVRSDMHTFSKFSNDEIILQLKGFLPGIAEILLNLALNTNQSIFTRCVIQADVSFYIFCFKLEIVIKKLNIFECRYVETPQGIELCSSVSAASIYAVLLKKLFACCWR